jgi:transmembrane sensor
MESSRQVEARAAAWLLKRESSEWGESDRMALHEWLETDATHRVAYLRLEAGWEEANRLKALSPGFQRGKVLSPTELMREETGFRPSSPRWQRRWIAAAASVLVLVIAGVLTYGLGPWKGERYVTPVGGIASIPLKDGSNVTLNTASEIRVRLTGTERRIELARGEAFFEVAKDPSRPFVVQAAQRRVVVVGTKFSVRRDKHDVRVFVSEGVVRIEDHGSPPATLAAGSMARVTGTQVQVRQQPVADVEESLSWRSGYVVFHETPLADAVAEFNRYNERPIVIADPQVAAIRLTGKFRTTNYEAFVRLLEETYPIQVRDASDRIVLSASR